MNANVKSKTQTMTRQEQSQEFVFVYLFTKTFLRKGVDEGNRYIVYIHRRRILSDLLG